MLLALFVAFGAEYFYLGRFMLGAGKLCLFLVLNVLTYYVKVGTKGRAEEREREMKRGEEERKSGRKEERKKRREREK